MSVAQLQIGVQLPRKKFVKPQKAPSTAAGVSAMMHRALAEPLAYPQLKDSVFPGDKLVIVFHADLPKPDEIVEAITDYLKSTEIPSGDIAVLTAIKLGDSFPNEATAETFVVHDSGDEQAVAYIAASDDGDPLYVNRMLFDADVILPVNCVSHNEELDEDCVYPRYSSAATMVRYLHKKGTKKSRQAEVARANEQLGIFVSVQVVTGPGGQVQEIIFGDKELAEKEARKKAKAIWAVEKQTATQLVIATMESNSQRQTWEQFCQAVIAADQVSDDCNQIVVCSDLAESPGPQFRKVLQLQFETDPEVVGKILKNASTTLRYIAEVIAEKRVYLQSQLPESVVEELGLGYIGSSEELQRLVDRVDSGVLLRDAHLCRIIST